LWLNREHNLFNLVVVGDAQREFGKDYNRYAFLLNRATRSSDLLMDRVSYLENEGIKEECARANSELLFCRLQDRVKDTTDALTDAEQSAVQNTRTDLDDFTPHEVNALVHQGAAVARAAWAAAGKNAVAWETAHGEAKSIFHQAPSGTHNWRECWRPLQPKPTPPFDLRAAARRRWGLVRPSDLYSWAFWLLLTMFFVVLPAGIVTWAVVADQLRQQAEKREGEARAQEQKEAAERATKIREFQKELIGSKVRMISTLGHVVMADSKPEWQFAKNRWEELDGKLSPRNDWVSDFLELNRTDIENALTETEYPSRQKAAGLAGVTLRLSHKLRNAILKTHDEDYILLLKDKRQEWFHDVRELAQSIETAAAKEFSAEAVKYARAEFLELYWGEMGMVEQPGGRVEQAMIRFKTGLEPWERAAPAAATKEQVDELRAALNNLEIACDSELEEPIIPVETP
jgi:hypothetical protein